MSATRARSPLIYRARAGCQQVPTSRAAGEVSRRNALRRAGTEPQQSYALIERCRIAEHAVEGRLRIECVEEGTAKRADVGKGVAMAQSNVQCLTAAHRETGGGALRVADGGSASMLR